MQHKSGVKKPHDRCFSLFLLRCLEESFSRPCLGASRMWLVRALQALGDPQTGFKPSCSQQCFIRGRISFEPFSVPQFVEASGALIWHWGNDHSWDLCSLGFPKLFRMAAFPLVIQCVCTFKLFPVSFHLVKVTRCPTWCSYTTSIENEGNHVHNILVSFDKSPTFIYQLFICY